MTASNKLLLTGETTANRFVVRVGEDRVPLPESRFFGLLVLIDVKSRRQGGRADLRDFEASGVAFEKSHLHQLIRRIRLDFSESLGNVGSELVVHEGRSRYSLAIALDDIVVTPEFLEFEADVPSALFLRIKAIVKYPDTTVVSSEASALSANAP